jgi:ABC-type transport system involved in cytochrome bd biosynthesis fused ATPase/permease subunit
MQKRLICKALLLEELVLKVSLIAGAVVVVVIVVILAFFLLFPASLIVLAAVLTAFVLRQVHREVLRRLCPCEIQRREELRTGSFTLLICVVS